VKNILEGKEEKVDGDHTTAAKRRVLSYRLKKHPVSGLSVMVPIKPTKRKIPATDVARLNSELL
jgi:hypothetical protein